MVQSVLLVTVVGKIDRPASWCRGVGRGGVENTINKEETLWLVLPICHPCRQGDTGIIHNFLSTGRELSSDSICVGRETAKQIITNDFLRCPKKFEAEFKRSGRASKTDCVRESERARAREKVAVSFFDKATHFLESKATSTGGLLERRERLPSLCHLSTLFVYRQNTVDRPH